MMEIAIKKGLTNHQTSMVVVVDQCKKHLETFKDTAFYEPFKNLTKFSQKEQKDL